MTFGARLTVSVIVPRDTSEAKEVALLCRRTFRDEWTQQVSHRSLALESAGTIRVAVTWRVNANKRRRDG